MKRNALPVLFTAAALCCGCICACAPTPEPEAEPMYGVGDTWSYGGVTISLNDAEYAADPVAESMELALTFTIEPTGEYRIAEEDLYVYTSVDAKIFSSAELNEERNGFDIFDKPIAGKTQYTFCFSLPFDNFADENDEIVEGLWWIRCFIRPATFFVDIGVYMGR